MNRREEFVRILAALRASNALGTAAGAKAYADAAEEHHREVDVRYDREG